MGAEFRQYRKTEKRQWVGEQQELQSLFNIIQAKLKTHRRPAYVPPQGLSVDDVENDMVTLGNAESHRRGALNAQLRKILDQLRSNFANQANVFAGELPAIQAAEEACDAANIEENDKTDHTYDDLWFAHDLLTKTYKRNVELLQNQLEASKTEDISPEQVEEFKETFKHFDKDGDDHLSKLEFKSCLSGLGVVELDFEGGDKRFESIFSKVAGGGENVDFQKFLVYMISITKDEESPEQIEDSFNVLAGGKDHVTLNDMRVGQLSDAQIAHLTSVLPAKEGIDGAFDYKQYVANLFN